MVADEVYVQYIKSCLQAAGKYHECLNLVDDVMDVPLGMLGLVGDELSLVNETLLEMKLLR